MKRSDNRILTTHAGSLPRPEDLIQMYQARARGEPQDEAALAARLNSAVSEVVKQQAEAGVDVVDDGEYAGGQTGSAPLNDAQLLTAAADPNFNITPEQQERLNKYLGLNA